MKRILIFMVLITVSVFSLSAQSVTVDFRIVGYEVDFMKLQNDLQTQIDKGYSPLGITGYNDKLYVLYLSSNVIPVKTWQLSRFSSVEEMDARIAEKIADGGFPAGYTSLNGNFYILFVENDYKASYYKVKETEIDSSKLHSEFSPFLRTGTIPMDFDLLNDRQIYLSVMMKNLPAEDWKQVSFDFESETLQQDIASEMTGRYLPWGLDITDGVLRISFIKFK